MLWVDEMWSVCAVGLCARCCAVVRWWVGGCATGLNLNGGNGRCSVLAGHAHRVTSDAASLHHANLQHATPQFTTQPHHSTRNPNSTPPYFYLTIHNALLAMTPEQFVVAVLTYDGPLAPLNPSFGITMTPAELITLVEQHPLRMLNVCNADGFAKRVAVARAAKLQAAIVSPNIPVLSKLLSSTAAPSWKSATMYYINGDVYTVVDQQVSAVWNPPPGDLVISDTVLKRAWVTLDRLASLIDVSACVALSLYTGMHAAQGGRIVAARWA